MILASIWITITMCGGKLSSKTTDRNTDASKNISTPFKNILTDTMLGFDCEKPLEEWSHKINALKDCKALVVKKQTIAGK